MRVVLADQEAPGKKQLMLESQSEVKKPDERAIERLVFAERGQQM